MSDKPKIDKRGFLKLMSPKKRPVNLFILIVSISAIIYTLIYLILGNGRFSDVFFTRCADFYMDFFNSIRDASQGSRVYTERGVIYPPMANLFYLIMSRFTPTAYNNTSFDNIERYSWPDYSSPMMLVVIVSVAFAFIFFFIAYNAMKNGSSYRRFAFAFLAFFSVPVLYLIERGNIIILALISLMIYAFTYNSEEKWKRELGLIALAFSFSIKLYPVVFGWLLIADKRWKDALKCVIYGVLMLLLPSVFFGGPACFYYVFLNIFDFSTGSGSTLTTILNFIHMPDIGQTVFNLLVYLWVLICGLSFAVSAFIRRNEQWKTWTLGLVTILCIPSLTSLYSWAFFIIPLIMLFNKQKLSKAEWVYTVMMCVPFAFLPFRFSFFVSPNMVMVYAATAALSIWCVIDTVKELKLFINQKKAEGISFKQYMKSLVSKD
ncbi:MAG: DUF2029 domain-containing protein [Clostridia bacterium]|nr:DUF2029 domain-containing protein [Clostridia bacterium]